ncbi:antibiotic biosynthesis monooxygenase [Fulvivirga sp. 29W222]|uniref:Antibiotic biosynthesis monooxygenase n=1 Tax=Fulvivirga marina TaxID=2494733 RepID=A0A937KAT1_9BACT|nr:antibiotic biosynthesis monooxygenase [Fulvivirga marina]MBL6444904.1 antibiotic biosynthesis monooxygenase [Fulvivirga marina]
MIARTWHEKVPHTKKDEYWNYLQKTGFQDYTNTKNNLGCHFLLITFWGSVESIKIFADEQYEKSRYHPEDASCLLEIEPFVQHYEVKELKSPPSHTERLSATT